MWFVAAAQFYVLVVIFIPSYSIYYVVMIQGGTMLFILVLTFQEYLWASTTRILLMRSWHNFEFNRHASKLISLQCVMIVALAYAVTGLYSVTLVASCIYSE